MVCEPSNVALHLTGNLRMRLRRSYLSRPQVSCGVRWQRCPMSFRECS
jgi:hypothetical protein